MTDKELDFWRLTWQRDRLIILLFIIYGLRISEFQSLNISSFNLNRNEFKIYRKRGKEVDMPLDEKVKKFLVEYLNRAKKQAGPWKKMLMRFFLSRQGSRLTTRAIQNLIKIYIHCNGNQQKQGLFTS